MNQWPGVKLRVIESWDEDNSHENNSLHYEGRAVDITTSDCDRSKYGMLARLAVESGFDWVYYKSRAHIHCSVKSDAMHPTHISGCFTPESTVITESGATKLMSDLRIGDRVLSMSEKGEPVYSEVILFMDRNMEQVQDFVKIGTEDGAVLTVTPAHLILTWNPKKGLMDYVFAEDIEENDFVLVKDAHGSLSPQRVVKLSAVVRKGVVAPLTAEGTIVVNSVAASCYAIVKSQSLAHWSMAPVRVIAKLESWLSSKSNAVSSTQSNEIATPKLDTTQQQNGVHWYAKMLYTLKDYVVPRSWRYQ
ncbi:protein hedgehog-like [Teleopsis dalmanni]|uniref:protein hedgehog-like n=1 Tax=Teleopsis dalmanni TaxID=139649 RepID=UPI0018CD2844|nr:protein hedgehog-like [Teleopsis dalmanni]